MNPSVRIGRVTKNYLKFVSITAIMYVIYVSGSGLAPTRQQVSICSTEEQVPQRVTWAQYAILCRICIPNMIDSNKSQRSFLIPELYDRIREFCEQFQDEDIFSIQLGPTHTLVFLIKAEVVEVSEHGLVITSIMKCGWNYLSIPKLQRRSRWSLSMDKKFHPTLYRACDYLSILTIWVKGVLGHTKQLFAAKYCSWHRNYTLVACAKFCCDIIVRQQN